MRILFISFLIFQISSQSFGQTSINENFDDNVEKLLTQMHQNKQFNGAVLVAQNGKIITEQSYGFANPETSEKLTERSSFRLASVSKQFTAMCIMILKERGNLDYDDYIRKYIPELPYADVTIRNLLHHTGGLPDYMDLFAKHWDTEKKPEYRKLAYNKDLVALFAKHEPEINFRPGEKWEYSNTGYVILGEIISRVSGQNVGDFLQKNIFEPLEMGDSRAFSNDEKFVLESRVYGFYYSGKGTQPNDFNYLNGMIGDGGVYASARDLLKWDQALYTEKLVKKSTLEEAFTSGKLNNQEETGYGFGWGVGKTVDGKNRVSHSGGWVGFRTQIIRVLDDKLAVIVLTNHTSNHLGNVLRELRKMLDGEDFFVPKPMISLALSKIIEDYGSENLLAEFDKLKANEADKWDIKEEDINALGYAYMSDNEFENAVAVFQLNVREYPDSWNVYDSLGEAYLEMSKANYRKSVEMNPANNNGRKILADLGETVKDFEIPESVLSDFVGKYQIFTEVFITVFKEGNQMRAKVTNQDPFDIFPSAPDKFYLKAVEAQITFIRNEEGKVDGMILHQGGDHPGRKIE